MSLICTSGGPLATLDTDMHHASPDPHATRQPSERPRPVARLAWELLTRTVRDSREDRITGSAAEVAFFVLLSLPPFLLIFAGTLGFVGGWFGPGVAGTTKDRILDALGTFLSEDTMRETVRPLVDDLFANPRIGLLSIGAVLAVWSASRMIRVLTEALNNAYDIEEWRPAWRRRLLSVGLTVGGMLALALLLPLLAAGPRLGPAIGGVFEDVWGVAYWPLAGLVGIALLATLYHVAPNWKTPWRRDVPGAVLAAIVWLLAALGLRLYVSVSLGGEGGAGPLAAPIALLLWIYISALAVLLGAELNAEIEKTWPTARAGPKAGGHTAVLERASRIARHMGRFARRRRAQAEAAPVSAAGGSPHRADPRTRDPDEGQEQQRPAEQVRQHEQTEQDEDG